MISRLKIVFVVFLCLFTTLPSNAAPEAKAIVPNLTKGGELTRINKRWVGPLGIYCGSWRPNNRNYAAEQPLVRQLLVLDVEEGSPADGILAEGDVILGADGTGADKISLFESTPWAMIPIAEAITEAEARNPAVLKLLIWRNGETQTQTIELKTLGRYSATAPYNCAKSKMILSKGIAALYASNQPDQSGFGILCLLAADDPTHPDNDKHQARAKQWAHDLEVGGSPWYSAIKLMAFSEYYMKTKDEAIVPKLVAQAEHHARGVSWFGTAGHRWSERQPDGSENGRIAGYGSITCSGTLGYLGLSLARKAGVDLPVVDRSVNAQRIFFGHYACKSAMGYGEHPYGIGNTGGDYNGKQATSGLAIGMDEGGEKKAKYFSRMATLASMDVRQYAHGGSFFGQVFHPLGAAQGGVKAANLQFREIRWHLDLKRRWDHTRIYDASGNRYEDFDYAATALLCYALPLRNLYLTGRGQSESLQFTDAEFQEILDSKNFDPTQATTDELVAALTQGHGMLRGPAGSELEKRVDAAPESSAWPELIDRLLALASDENNSPNGRTGACFALMKIKDRSREPVASMKNADIAKTMVGLLKDQDAYIRFAGTRVLQALAPEAVRPHANQIMDAIIGTGRPTFPLDEEDPLQWAHGEMGQLLFVRLLNKNIDGVDRDKLIAAIRSILKTPNGGARSVSTSVLRKLSKTELLEVADLVVDNIKVSPPANAMFAAKAAANSQSALAKHRFEEALPLSAVHGVKASIEEKIPQKYGKAALDIQAAEAFLQAVGEQILIEAVDAQAVIEGIENGTRPEELNKLKRIDGVRAADDSLNLPTAKTQLVVDATNFAMRGKDETIYTWRKVYGSGKVSFKPNATGQSKTTTVTFTDKKPGNYRFEVTMSDKLGLNVVRKTVDVSLYNASGKLPSNRPPQAKSQSLDATPGQPVPVVLSGSDPDGDDLGFVVTEMPAHGRLTDGEGRPIDTQAAIDGALNYTADFGYNGADRFTFIAMDGQGEVAKATIKFKVSDKNVGVAIYEGFDYPAGKIHGREGDSSFGFSGPWQGSRDEQTTYMIQRGPLDHSKGSSLSHPSLPSTGGRLSGQRHTTLSRLLDPKVLAKHNLLDNGTELWFSVVIDQPDLTFELRGPAIGLGFKIKGHKNTIHATLNGEETGTARNPYSRSSKLRFPDTEPSMIIGRCVWGKTDKDIDTLTIHRVFDAPRFGPLFLQKPVCALESVIDQQTLNSVHLYIDTNKELDEIRIGPTRNSVMMGTQPLR